MINQYGPHVISIGYILITASHKTILHEKKKKKKLVSYFAHSCRQGVTCTRDDHMSNTKENNQVNQKQLVNC